MEKLQLVPQIMSFIRLILASICFLSATANVATADTAPPFEYGPRPPQPLFDPTGFLTPDQAAKIVEPLQAIHKKDGADVFIVILPDLGDAPPKYIADRFGEAWCDPNIHAVVLFSPSKKQGPWIVPGGKFLEAMKPGAVEKAVAAAQRRAASEPFDSNKIGTACTEAADLLRYWAGGMETYGENLQTLRTHILTERAEHQQQLKYLGLAISCAAIPLILFCWWLVRRRRQSGPRHFPEPSFSRRLGAPYCGGNSITIELENSHSAR